MGNFVGDIRFMRIMAAKEIICPSIIFSIHDQDTKEIKTFSIDYIYEDFKNVTEAVNQYLLNGNKSGKVRGYGTKDVFTNNDFSNKKILYYDETNSYLWDPTACAPANTLPSCFVDYEVPTEPIKLMLEQFLDHLAINEPDDSKLFERVTFTPKDEIEKRKDEFEHLRCFFDLIESTYFDKNLF